MSFYMPTSVFADTLLWTSTERETAIYWLTICIKRHLYTQAKERFVR